MRFSFTWILKLLCIAILSAASYVLALGLRFDFVPAEFLSTSRLFLPLTILILLRLAATTYWEIDAASWRHFSTVELASVTKAHMTSSVAFAALILLFQIPSFSRGVLLGEFFLSILATGSFRLALRRFTEYSLKKSALLTTSESKAVIVLGAGDSGHLLIKTILSYSRMNYRPVAVLDDSDRAQGISVHGVPVKGRVKDLSTVLQKHPLVSAVIVAIPSMPIARFKMIEEECRGIGVAVKRLQAFEDIACHDASMPQTAISIESVLDKQLTFEHENEILEALRGKRVLITGAGGSIGSELVRQILLFEPSRVILFDNSEYNVFRAQLEFERQQSKSSKRYIIGSICDAQRLEATFREENPQIVFHAAAYKHVPLMEHNCSEAFKNNVVGTLNLLNVCATHGVERFVLISTDKAVDPSSVMGCTKRLAEWLVQQFSNKDESRQSPNGGLLNTAVVRFGNVINSAGSVIPLFREQILNGGPITVTHPDVERYFMSIQEAVRLVLTAGTLGERGEIYVLDMGKKIRIVDVAKKMAALYGRRDIPIVYSGLRAGEKLTEDLHGQMEHLHPTEFSKVRKLDRPPLPIDVREAVRLLEQQLANTDDYGVGQALHVLVSETIRATAKPDLGRLEALAS